MSKAKAGESMDVTEFGLDDLAQFGRAAYGSVGVPDEDAAIIVDAQLEADRRGVDTHGFQRLRWYVDRLLTGDNNPRPRIDVVGESAVSVVLDGDAGLGQLVCTRLTELTMVKARTVGMAVGVCRRSNDWGCGARYPRMAALDGFVAFATTTSIPTLAPFGTRTRMTGNNPMAFAVPRREHPPMVLDMALTPVALGKVMRAAATGEPIPREWGFLDREGVSTDDPGAALAGVIPAIGGYKGTGLSLIMNVLAGILSGSEHSSAVANEGGKRGQLVWVVDPGLLGERDRFFDEVEEMVGQVKSAEPLPGFPGPFLPGEIEQAADDAARARGTILYPEAVVADLSAVAERIGIPLPSRRSAGRESRKA
jgi:LDH2 family malate/lactate/ureidoglycolate dehydrogenase